MAAIDNAFWDIVGKACKQPLYKLWGGKVNAPIHVRYWMDCGSPEEMGAEAVKAVQRGWKAFKIKLGTDPESDVERVRAIREVVGDRVQLCFDINGGYPMNVAISTLKRMARYNPASTEDPVPCHWPYDAGALD
jgi:D-galactarolactone cycloisomerase